MSQRRPLRRTATPPAAPARTQSWKLPTAATVFAGLALVGAGFAYLEKLTSDCKVESSRIIDEQEKLRAEILSRREKFVQTAMRATSIEELREFLAHRDSLHGYIFRDFADRSLPELEDEEQRNGKYMDEPSFFALDLVANFASTRIDAAADDTPEHPKTVTLRALDALQVQHASSLVDSDLSEVKHLAGIEWLWLFKQRIDEMHLGRLIAACNVGVAIGDLFDDVRYLNRPAVHVIYDPDTKIPASPTAD